jgi:hypothetical protein
LLESWASPEGEFAMRLFPSLDRVRDRLRLMTEADRLEAEYADAALEVVDDRLRSARDRGVRMGLYRLRDELTRRRAVRAAYAAAYA